MPAPLTSNERRNVTARRTLLIAVAWAAVPGWAAAQAARPATRVEVWTSPSCGCCKNWGKHLETDGLRVKTHDDSNTDARQRLALPLKYGSCHTAEVGGYAIEGHVPAREIRRLLEEQPMAVGLAVPSMPVGSPGMDGPEYGLRRDSYDVLLVRKDGSASPFQSYR